MARLARGRREQRERSIFDVVRRSLGIKESEIADETGLDRRVVNNYLRELDEKGKVYKRGWYWFRD